MAAYRTYSEECKLGLPVDVESGRVVCRASEQDPEHLLGIFHLTNPSSNHSAPNPNVLAFNHGHSDSGASLFCLMIWLKIEETEYSPDDAQSAIYVLPTSGFFLVSGFKAQSRRKGVFLYPESRRCIGSDCGGIAVIIATRDSNERNILPGLDIASNFFFLPFHHTIPRMVKAVVLGAAGKSYFLQISIKTFHLNFKAVLVNLWLSC